ncbi:BgTH12-06726 [Blumeria graminis f. sp. triticale]|uniref:Bgt-50734 n=4 Tax=Blumeria graminis TaxID=34373 RepID=A0A9X9PSG9_BLUGR|nr:BgTH12-06726 [Blumeria graminis f. sp. triticale]VCU41331.1 Bgt-50734 [Blumeria graminis f. sp. tritici]
MQSIAFRNTQATLEGGSLVMALPPAQIRS